MDKLKEKKKELDQALMEGDPTEKIYQEINDLERKMQRKELESARIEQLKKIEELKDKIEKQSKLLDDLEAESDSAKEKLNQELLPELEEKKKAVNEVKKKANQARQAINRERTLKPDKERKIEEMKQELKELKAKL